MTESFVPDDSQSAEMIRLTSACLSQDISSADLDRLNELLNQDESARQAYLRFMSDSQGLRAWAEALVTQQDTDETGDEKASAIIIDVKPANFSRRHKRFDSIHWQRHKIRFNAMTAVLTALAWIGFSYFVWFSTTPDDSRPNRTGTIQYVAEITGQHEHQWAEGMPLVSNHAALLSGQRLNLAEGLIEITFDDGAVVVLEGPAEFVVESPGAGTLDRGRIVTKVPQEAVGFTIHTAHADVVDLGTEFGVSVDSDGSTEVHVLDGEVRMRLFDATGQITETLHLLAGKAGRVDPTNGRMTTFVAQYDSFHRQIPSQAVLGSEPIARSTTDHASGVTLIYRGSSSIDGQAEKITFYSDKVDYWVTPLILEYDEATSIYTITAIGKSIHSNGSGLQSVAFEVVAGINSLSAGRHTCGFFDGRVAVDLEGKINVLATNAGVISTDFEEGAWLYAYDSQPRLVELGRTYGESEIADEQLVASIASMGRMYSASFLIQSVTNSLNPQ